MMRLITPDEDSRALSPLENSTVSQDTVEGIF